MSCKEEKREAIACYVPMHEQYLTSEKLRIEGKVVMVRYGTGRD